MLLLLPIGLLVGLIAMLDDDFNWVEWALDEVERERGKHEAFIECLRILSW